MPWNARCCRSSFDRWQASSLSLSTKEIPGGTGVWSLPMGPWICREVAETSTLTPLGTAMILRPTRDIGAPCLRVLAVRDASPYVAENLATHALAGRGAPGHEPPGGGQDVDAEASVDAGNLVLAAVNAAAGTAHPLEIGD